MSTSLSSVTYSNTGVDDATQDTGDPYDDYWLFMEQEYFPPAKQHADFNDVYNMYLRARSGLSAQSYIMDACAVDVRREGDYIVVPLEFYVFVPANDFEYELTTNVAEEFSETVFIKGSIKNDGIGYVRKGYTTAFTMTDKIQFDHRVEDLSYVWESPVFNALGEQIRGSFSGMVGVATPLEDIQDQIDSGVHFQVSPAQLAARGRFVVAGDSIFGVTRMKYRAPAKLHTLELWIEPQGNQQFKNIRPTVIATWLDEAGNTKTTTLSLEIPQCVYDSMMLCGDGYSTMLLINPYKNKKIVYYSTCDGKFLTVREAGSYKRDYARADK